MPHYRFEEHKGYSTPAHFEALHIHGASIHHRRSFAPVRIALGLEPPPDADLFGEIPKAPPIALPPAA
jgi:ribonuclease HII